MLEDLAFIGNKYIWPHLKSVLQKFESCAEFVKLAKGQKKNGGLCQPLVFPHSPWEDLNMNFALGLPKTVQKVDSMFMVVDQFANMAYFILCSTIANASKITQLLFREEVPLHR